MKQQTGIMTTLRIFKIAMVLKRSDSEKNLRIKEKFRQKDQKHKVSIKTTRKNYQNKFIA